MSTIDPNSTATLNKILEKIGVKSNDDASSKKKDTLGQSDFLKLMTTQLQNQDPFAPMENGDFIAQMAQFSTVTGIAEMGESLKSLSNQLGEFRAGTFATAIGPIGATIMGGALGLIICIGGILKFPMLWKLDKISDLKKD